MIPILTGFLNEHALRDVTVVADAGMVPTTYEPLSTPSTARTNWPKSG